MANATSSGSGNVQQELQNLEAAELAIALKPVYVYLTALQQPGANVETAVAGFKVLELNEMANEPLFESVGINNVALGLQNAISAWEQKVTGGSTSAPTTAAAA
jgi:hypothetical protein